MEYKVISESNMGVVVQHDDILTACKLCKYKNTQCLINDAIDCSDGRYLTIEEENEYYKSKNLNHANRL